METFNIISGTASIIGVIGTILGFLSWIYEKKKRKKLEEENNRRVWSDISKVKGLMENIESDLKKDSCLSGALMAHGNLTFMFRDLLVSAVSFEKNFSLGTIYTWRKTGKLSSDWQEKIALTILFTKEVNLDKLDEDSLNKYSSWDALPDGHPAYSKVTLKK